jgi:2-(1,2-epoxy-1,2-dihydrophenyl)acetyl-CoA isomerase
VLLLIGARTRILCGRQDLSDRAGGATRRGPVDLGESIESNYRPLVLGLRSLALPGRVRGQRASLPAPAPTSPLRATS